MEIEELKNKGLNILNQFKMKQLEINEDNLGRMIKRYREFYIRNIIIRLIGYSLLWITLIVIFTITQLVQVDNMRDFWYLTIIFSFLLPMIYGEYMVFQLRKYLGYNFFVGIDEKEAKKLHKKLLKEIKAKKNNEEKEV